jgi:hypothetical protein
VGHYNGAVTMENTTVVPQEIKNIIITCSTKQISYIYSKELKAKEIFLHPYS